MITVYVPTWNSARTLKRCLDSIVRAIPNAKICVVDQASTDATKAIAEKYGEYIVFMGNLGEKRTYICEVASKRAEPFMMVDSDIELPQHFYETVKQFMTPSVGAVYGRKLTEAAKPQKYETYVYSSYKFPVVNSKRLDTSCTLFNPEAVKGFAYHLFSCDDYALGRHIRSKGFSYILLDIPCRQLGLDDFKVYLAHVRWDGAGKRLLHLPDAWKSFVSLVWMPLKSPCKLVTLQVRLHHIIGFMLPNLFLEYDRGKVKNRMDNTLTEQTWEATFDFILKGFDRGSFARFRHLVSAYPLPLSPESMESHARIKHALNQVSLEKLPVCLKMSQSDFQLLVILTDIISVSGTCRKLGDGETYEQWHGYFVMLQKKYRRLFKENVYDEEE